MLTLLAAGGACLAVGRWARGNRHVHGWFEELRAEAEEEMQASTAKPVALVVLDDKYQRFMLEKCDPWFGRNRNEHLATIIAGDESPAVSDYERKVNRYLAAAVAATGTALVGSVFPPFLIVSVGAGLYSTTVIFKMGYEALVHEHKLRFEVMESLFCIGIFAGGYFAIAGFGLVAYHASQKLLLITQDRSQQSLVKIMGQQPRTVWQLVDDIEVEVPVESLRAGDTIVIQAGQVVPVDGVITSGIATIDQHMLTGESKPAEKGEGDQVLTATLMIAGKVQVQVEKTGEETAAAQIGATLNKTASYQASIVARGQQVADKSVPPTMLLALVALPVSGYVYMVTILGAAVGLSIKLTAPIAMLNFLNIAADQGILIKDGRSLELLKDVDTVIFDKTGTLTLDQPDIAEIHAVAHIDADTVLMYAAAAEHRQVHPVARAILDEAARRGLHVPEVDRAHYESGYGLSVRLDDHLIRVGSDRYMALEKIKLPAGLRAHSRAAQEQGHSLVMVAVDGRLVGAIELVPTLRPEVKAVVRELRKRNVDIFILSGDQEEPTRMMAEALGIPHYFANALPEDKANRVAELQSQGRSVCFVGDGINDSISMKKANVSVSLRGASTAATDTAQIVLMSRGLEQLPFVFELAQELDSNMKAGFTVAVGQGVIVIGGALLAVVSVVPGTFIWVGGLLTGVGIAQLPLLRHKSREA